MGTFNEIARGGSPRPIKQYITEDSNGINWIKIGDTIKGDKYIYSTKEKIKPEGIKKSRYVEDGDFLLTNSMSFGRPYILKTNGCIHDGWLVIKLNEDLFYQDFMFYLLSSNLIFEQFSKLSAGSAVKNLKIDSVKKVLIPIPPLNEQKIIVDRIEKILPLIEEYGKYKEQLDKINLELPIKLRSSILQEAIQGKLVSQGPNDEPASVLLEKIKEEKERLIKEKKIKRNKNESFIYKRDNHFYEKIGDNKPVCIDDEIPFEIPDNWAWVRLDSVCKYIQRGKSPKYSEIKKFPVVAQKCNQWSGFSLEKAKFIDPKTVDSYNEERILQNKDIMWNSTGLGTLGRVGLYDESVNKYGWAVADSHVTIIRPFAEYILQEFIYLFLASPTVQLVIESKAGGSTKQKELNLSTIKNYLIPLAPYNEQKKIIEKVHNLNKVLE